MDAVDVAGKVHTVDYVACILLSSAASCLVNTAAVAMRARRLGDEIPEPPPPSTPASSPQ